MDTSAPHVSASSWRAVAQATEIGFGSVYYQPGRLDVLVHLLAYEQLAGAELVGDYDWVSASDAFAISDNEPTVATLAAELMTSPNAELEVTFASGGQLVRGASAAAVSIATRHQGVRRDGSDKIIDRSVVGLSATGWPASQLQQLLIEWARRDNAAAVVLVDLDDDGADDAIHELTCRYELMHDELEYLSADDALRLDARGFGSTQVLCIRVGDTLPTVLERHAGAIRACSAQTAAAIALATLWQSERADEVSSAHSQRVRRIRRREVTDQLLERVLGR